MKSLGAEVNAGGCMVIGLGISMQIEQSACMHRWVNSWVEVRKDYIHQSRWLSCDDYIFDF